MRAQEVLKASLKMTQRVYSSYVSDLTDEELMLRPGPGCNHIAWQLGHLISSNTSILNAVLPDAAPSLPEGFDQKHGKSNSGSDDPKDFLTKDQYVTLFSKLDDAIVAAIDRLSEADLDQPSPEAWRGKFPTIGSLAVVLVAHTMMHVGQWVPIRRKLQKPVLI